MQSFSEIILFYGNNIFSTLSTIFITYKQNMHGYALHVTIVYKYTFLRYYCFSTLSGIIICLIQTMHRCALHVPIFYKYAFFTVLLFSVKLSEIVDYNRYMHRCALRYQFSTKVPFYSNTISSNIINTLYRLQTEHATMCSACTHFLQRYFTVVQQDGKMFQTKWRAVTG